ncbi:MAG: HPr(Ser) kinase/phosphatase [Kiritimatiellia bacterium]|nr:HPr(Ser) kinase/phosphatase [Kiritimatiellia bacterium]
MALTVRQFYEEGRSALHLSLLKGEQYLDRVIREESLNRPGLALSGFLKYFAHRRLQIFGWAEQHYLKSLPRAEQTDRLRAFFQQAVPGVVLSRGIRPPGDMARLAEEFRTPLLRTSLITHQFLRLAGILIEDLVAPTIRVQGTMVDIRGVGVLLEGAPGTGKSEIALGLITRGSSLVADDLTELRRIGSGGLMATAPEATRYHMEIRGLGIIHVPSLYGVAAVRRSKRLDMIVRLERMQDLSDPDRTGIVTTTRTLLDVPVPCVTLPVATGREVVQIVEAAALNHRLRVLGHDAAKELDQRLMDNFSGEAVRTSD